MSVVVHARGIEDAWVEGCHQFLRFASPAKSRNGCMYRVRGSFVTVYSDPTSRVLFDPARNCNPFFHLMESIWMLAGQNDVKSISHYNKQMAAYSDDGSTFNGAYGFRWRNHFKVGSHEVDQINHVITRLRDNEDDRRCVIQMYDVSTDTTRILTDGKDIPCNLLVSFHTWDGKLDMTVFNRSNDLVWGAYGSNVVHFSMLQELVASAIGCRVGEYSQISANTHVYDKHMDLVRETAKRAVMPPEEVPLVNGHSRPLILPTENSSQFLLDCEASMSESGSWDPLTAFFREVIQPMQFAWDMFKTGGGPVGALWFLNGSDRSVDWIEAGCQWLLRTAERRAAR